MGYVSPVMGHSKAYKTANATSRDYNYKKATALDARERAIRDRRLAKTARENAQSEALIKAQEEALTEEAENC